MYDPITINNVSIVAVDVVPDVVTPQPTPGPTPAPGGEDPGSSDSSGSSGCTVASGPINLSGSAFNFAVMILPLLVFGMRSLRRKK